MKSEPLWANGSIKRSKGGDVPSSGAGRHAGRHRKAEGTSDTRASRHGSRVLDRNIHTVLEMEKKTHRARALPERIGDAIAGFAGSMLFIVLHLLWFGGWVVINLRVLHGVRPFDPYPFTFLTFCVSLEAIILSSFVLISQNHMSRQADERAQLDNAAATAGRGRLTISAPLDLMSASLDSKGVRVS